MTERWKSVSDLPEGDTCAGREEENFCKNLELVERVKKISAEKDAAPGQLALAWVLARGDDIVPIPGTKRREYLEENAAVTDLELNDEDLRRIEEAMPRGSVAGERYYDKQMRAVNR